jgi:hypothetical protein
MASPRDRMQPTGALLFPLIHSQLQASAPHCPHTLPPQEHGMIDGPSLAAEMHHGFAEGIGCNLRGLRKCEHLILLMRVNKDTLVDVKLCCVMLRALWSLGIPCNGGRGGVRGGWMRTCVEGAMLSCVA